MFNTLLKDKQVLHAVAEVIILSGLVYYFNQQNKKIFLHIENLSQRVEEQEDIIQKHEIVIKKLSESFIKMSKQIEIFSVQNHNTPTQKEKYQQNYIDKKSNKRNIPYEIKVENTKSDKQVSFNSAKAVESFDYCSDSDSDSDSDNSLIEDLDNEISDELQELGEIDLKKKE